MAFFIATGTISNDVVRKETRNGVLTTFRLETGAPRGRKLWIDVECWGHLAGTIAHHGESGRTVNVSGRLAQKSWRDAATGEARQRFVITAQDVDLKSGGAHAILVPNAVVLRGDIDAVLPSRATKSGVVTRLRVSDGRAGSKTGRLVLRVDYWSLGEVEPELQPRAALAASGGLSHASREEGEPSGLVLIAQVLDSA